MHVPDFLRGSAEDRFGRTINYFLSQPLIPAGRLPLVVYVQGSGCHSLFRLGPEGRVHGRYQNLLLNAARTEIRVLAVEKPGVSFLDDPERGGTAEHCSKQFLEEHTLERWNSAIVAAIRHVRATVAVDPRGMLVLGHSEGGLVAASLAASDLTVTHVGLIGSNGPTQLFDLLWLARERQESAAAKTSVPSDELDSPADIYRTFEQIRADPSSVERFAWGHPFRRWSSFFATSTLDELLKSQANVFMAHGTNDQSVPYASFELARAELIRRGRRVVSMPLEGADHRFQTSAESGHALIIDVFRNVVNWFLSDLKR